MTASQGEAVAPPEAWDAIAEGYDLCVAPQEVDLANEALRLARVAAGRAVPRRRGRAAGAQPAGRTAGARVLATDWSPAMVDRFEARVREEGLINPISGVVVADLNEDQRARLRQVLDDVLRERRDERASRLRERGQHRDRDANIGIGTK
jgi:hypothetical protein